MAIEENNFGLLNPDGSSMDDNDFYDFGEGFEDFRQSEEYRLARDAALNPENAFTSDFYTSDVLGGFQFGSGSIGRNFEDAYTAYINRTQGGDSKASERYKQSLVAGTPQDTSEVNIVDYMGQQAIDPSMQSTTQLLDRLKELGVRPEDLANYYTLGTLPGGEIEYKDLEAKQIEAPTLPKTKLVEGNTVELEEKPELAKMEALKVYDQVSNLADSLQAAKLEYEDIDPRATLVGQLSMLQQQFADGKIPGFAQGAIRQVNKMLSAQGIGGSSMAAEAITNALMTSSMDIAADDAAFYQKIARDNLSNEQEVVMEKFTSRVDAIFKDQAAENLARNVNADNENQLNQFYTQLAQSVGETNAIIMNGVEEFNATAFNQAEQFGVEIEVAVDKANMQAVNDMATFNAEMSTNIAMTTQALKDSREKFNATAQMEIDAFNIGWRRDTNEANTSAYNAALQFDTTNLFDLQNSALNNIWNHFDTILNMAWKSEESQLDRAAQIALTTLQEEIRAKYGEDADTMGFISGLFSAGAKIVGSETGGKILQKWGIL